MTLPQLRTMFPRRADKFKSEPLPDCPRCKGVGTYLSGNRTTEPCICIFLSGDPALRRDVTTAFCDSIKRIRKEMLG